MRIVLGSDGSTPSLAAVELVASRRWPDGTAVRLLGVASPAVDWAGLAPVPGGAAVDLASLAARLEEQADQLRLAGLDVEVEAAVGPAAEVLMARADETLADLIVVGSRRRGPAASIVLGSVSTALVDHAPCPVLVVRRPQMGRMLLASDGTVSSRDIPRVLDAWGPAFRGLPVEVLSVAGPTGIEPPWAAHTEREDDVALHERIADAVADELMDLGWHAAAIARSGEPGVEIVRAGDEWGADLIVTGSRGIGALRRFLAGSVAHDVLLHTSASVLVVRGLVHAEVRRRAPIRALGLGGALG